MNEPASHTNFHGLEAPAHPALSAANRLCLRARTVSSSDSPVGGSARVQCKIHSNGFAAHHGQNGSKLGPERDQHRAAVVSAPRPSRARAVKSRSPAGIVRSVAAGPARAAPLVHQHL
jgi:hypothetical protein